MKAFVTEDCIGCGLCETICPEIFHMADSGMAEAEKDVPEELNDKVEDAAESCPVSAIKTE